MIKFFEKSTNEALLLLLVWHLNGSNSCIWSTISLSTSKDKSKKCSKIIFFAYWAKEIYRFHFECVPENDLLGWKSECVRVRVCAWFSNLCETDEKMKNKNRNKLFLSFFVSFSSSAHLSSYVQHMCVVLNVQRSLRHLGVRWESNFMRNASKQ